ncbi:MAG TPA: hypothetical protein VMJ75_24955 [Candidatus Acidoferrales bacterium]|nr:hypothetical protein [Candidatus Acidoferrales bacterium]
MPIAKITGQGLATIGLSVALLWGCFLCERLTVRQAAAQQALVMRELREMQRYRKTEPVSVPAPRIPRPERVTMG